MQLCALHNHKEQYLLDIMGYPVGSFGEYQIDARKLVEKLWHGAESIHLSDGQPARAHTQAVQEAYEEAMIIVERLAEKAGQPCKKKLIMASTLISKRAKEVLEK